MHDVWQLPNEDSYNLCNFNANGANKVSDASTSASFNFECDGVGTYYFACSVDDACNSGNQKVRIYVSDPAKTLKLRAKGVVSLEAFNRKYTLLFAGYFLNQQNLAGASLDDAVLDAKSLLAHSPESCSDWIPASWNSNQSCQAFIYTDLGFISRAGPDPDFSASERYYMQALEISPGMCGATSYLAELRVQQNMKEQADELYVESCKTCGRDSMDFHDLRFAYEKRGWTPPPCTSPSNEVVTVLNFPVNAGATELPIADTTGLFEGMLLKISDGTSSEEKTIIRIFNNRRLSSSGRRLAAGTVTLDSPLWFSYAAGASVICKEDVDRSGIASNPQGNASSAMLANSLSDSLWPVMISMLAWMT